MDNDKNNAYVATIGFFDGVHRGHRFLVEQVRAAAARRGLRSMVITFDRHPRQVLRSDYQPQLLSTLDDKVAMIRQTGVDHCEVLHFDETMASLSARQFMQQVLKERLGVSTLVIGYDNRFGHNREEGFDDYVAYGKEIGMEVVKARAFVLNGINVSSSVIRAFLSEGEVAMAAKCLGRNYSLSGHVVTGFQEGRKMGFPTANINMDEVTTMLPATGAYAAVAQLEDDSRYPAMLNIGTRPTFDGTATTIEVNLIGYEGNLYGALLRVDFVERLRPERRFKSEKALMEQLAKDRAEAVRIVGSMKESEE